LKKVVPLMAMGLTVAIPVLASSLAKGQESPKTYEVNDWKEPPKGIPWATVVEIKSPFESYKAVYDQDYKGRSCFISCNFYDGFISRWTADQLSLAQFSTYCFSGNCRKSFAAIPYGVELSIDGIQYSLSGNDGLFALNAKVRKALAAMRGDQKIAVRIGGNNQVIYNIGSTSSKSIADLMQASINDDKGVKATGITISAAPAVSAGSMVQPIIKRAIPGVAQIETPTGKGTGFLISSKGLIITNRHVIGRFGEVVVKFYDGKETKASVIGRTSDLDIALLQLENSSNIKTWPALPLCIRKSPSVGEDIVVIGNPLGLQATTTRGIVSGIRNEDGSTIIQIDAPVNPGNSGGPVINYNAEVVGIVTSKQVAIGIEGIGYAIGISSALESLGLKYQDPVLDDKSKKGSKLTACGNVI